MLHSLGCMGADEIDAIGEEARGGGGGDAGTRERESGLLQLLYEMDGFNQNDRVLARSKPVHALALSSTTIRTGYSCGLKTLPYGLSTCSSNSIGQSTPPCCSVFLIASESNKMCTATG